MSDPSTIDESDQAGEGSALIRPDQEAVKATVDSILSLDDILTSARRAERVVPICTDGPLQLEYDRVLAELAELVDAEGNPLTDDDASLADDGKVAQLNRRANELLPQVRQKTVYFRFRAMDSDAFDEFDDSHRTGSDKRLKNPRKYENELIAACAVSPAMAGPADVDKIRKTFGASQVVALFNGAYYVNKRDGVDIPKSPSFLHAPKPQE